MTSLYSAPLNVRMRSYYNENTEKQINERNDYIRNQQYLYDERMARNAMALFNTQKEINDSLKEESKNLNALEFQEKLNKKNPEIFYLPPSETAKRLAIEQPKIFALPPSTRQALEAEQEGKPRGGTPKSSASSTPEQKTPKSTPKTEIPSRKPDGGLTPFSQLAEDAKLRVKLMGDPIYEDIRKAQRSTQGGKAKKNEEGIAETIGLPKKDLLKELAKKHNLDFDNSATVKENVDKMLKSLYEKRVSEGVITGDGLLRNKRKNNRYKYRR